MTGLWFLNFVVAAVWLGWMWGKIQFSKGRVDGLKEARRVMFGDTGYP